jgi:hypothetical protein
VVKPCEVHRRFNLDAICQQFSRMLEASHGNDLAQGWMARHRAPAASEREFGQAELAGNFTHCRSASRTSEQGRRGHDDVRRIASSRLHELTYYAPLVKSPTEEVQ